MSCRVYDPSFLLRRPRLPRFSNRKLKHQHFWAMDSNWKWTIFLFYWSSLDHIYIVKYLHLVHSSSLRIKNKLWHLTYACFVCFFFSSFIPRFISNLYKCKPISTVGAEQVLSLPLYTLNIGISQTSRYSFKIFFVMHGQSTFSFKLWRA